MENGMVNFYRAASDGDYTDAKLLFEAYAASINIDLDFQHFDEELNALKKMYSAPFGGIILVKAEDKIVGCAALRKIDDITGEIKRMYVQPGHQNKGIGKALLEEIFKLASACNYTVVRLDTLNYMYAAISLYRRAGFSEIPAYYYNPIANAVYFEKKLPTVDWPNFQVQ